ncbi:glycyl-radical enzyme activating protein [Paenibacillus anaericanus]|uniref:glycyl-radical enzyme activating protein n=1 Tax=Paenibacillus anaericanus TaxID=170367 RepID=UPI0027D7F249|nr:glycyl-radical enzyme activating protein [Paenibacillus anaericanus]
MEESGIVFDIARFSLHDGDGIRTTVFLKGCPLRCLWCHNPESQKFDPEVYPREEEPGDLRTIGSPMSVSEVINVVIRDLPYYKRSGGGLTLSGGEPLAQPDFSLALLQEAKRRGLHTCVETSGYAHRSIFERLFPFVDCFLFDSKEYNVDQHKEYTGRSNNVILANLQWLCEQSAPIILRCPIIPGLNDRPDHFAAIAKWVMTNSNISRAELLAYHPYGRSKGDGWGSTFTAPIPTEEDKANWLSIIRSYGCEKVIIG